MDNTDIDALRLSVQRGFAGVPPDVIVALLTMLDELVSVREERDEAREIIEQLRRHGCDWIVEAGNKALAAERVARLRAEDALWEWQNK